MNVHAVACKPVIVDLEARVLDGDRHEHAVRVDEHGTKSDAGGLALLKIRHDVGSGKTRPDNVLDNDYMTAFYIGRDILGDVDHAGLVGRIRNAAEADEIDLYRHVEFAGKVGQEIQSSPDNAYHDNALPAVILFDLSGQRLNARLYRLLIKDYLFDLQCSVQ